jgi:hypothetical protein
MARVAEVRVSPIHRRPKERPPVFKTGRVTGAQALPQKLLHFNTKARPSVLESKARNSSRSHFL